MELDKSIKVLPAGWQTRSQTSYFFPSISTWEIKSFSLLINSAPRRRVQDKILLKFVAFHANTAGSTGII